MCIRDSNHAVLKKYLDNAAGRRTAAKKSVARANFIMIDVTFSSQVVFQGKFETSLLKSNLYTNFVMNNYVISC